jgi:membrane protein
VKRFLTALDNFQQRHPFIGFPYAVIKKYGDDQAAYQGALITYYGFLSLFPLLIVLTSFLQLIFRSHTHLRDRVLTSIDQYFPIAGNQLHAQIHSPHRTGLALIVGLLITLYGARGGADAFRNAMNHIWQVPRADRGGFPGSILTGLKIIVLGGMGLISATLLSSFASSLGKSVVFRALATVISVVVLFAVFLLIFKIGTARRFGYRKFVTGALVAAVGIQIIQSIGGFIITHQLKNMTSLYGTFALVLGMLFWIYLQVQIILYAVEINSVRVLKLWPRSLMQEDLTPQDKKAYKMYAKKERLQPEPPQKVDVSFKGKPKE